MMDVLIKAVEVFRFLFPCVSEKKKKNFFFKEGLSGSGQPFELVDHCEFCL